jgi:uncharacterized protein YjbI with pentapeptide repeats
MLTDKAKRYHQALHAQIKNDAIRDGLRQQLPSNIFVQFLAGAPETRSGLFGWTLRGVGWTTLVIGPVLLLLLIQIQFLPFHSWITAWIHRPALLADVILIWWLWGRILSGREVENARLPWLRLALAGLWAVLTLCALIGSWTLATFLGEPQEALLAVWRPIHDYDESGIPTTVSIHDWFFKSRINRYTGQRRFPFSSTLVLTGFDIYEGLKIDDLNKVKGREYQFRVPDRDLTGAIFDFANLRQVDFEGARLRGASLKNAQLQGASFAYAQLEVASLIGAQLQGVQLDGAELQGASLASARLQGASLDRAQLQGASLDFAELQGASLTNADLRGASLTNAQLQGASLGAAQLQGASLILAALQATDLRSALLWRSNAVQFSSQIPWATLKPKDVALKPDVEDWRSRDTWQPVYAPHNISPWDIAAYKGKRWDGTAYQALSTELEALPAGHLRNEAQGRIGTLNCVSKELAPCGPDAPLPLGVREWQMTLENAKVKNSVAYDQALAETLKSLVCSGDDHAIEILRGLIGVFPTVRTPLGKSNASFVGQLKSTGLRAPDLIDFIMSSDCRVSTTLTDNVRARLLEIRSVTKGPPAYNP